jgi:hypothetical protein
VNIIGTEELPVVRVKKLRLFGGETRVSRNGFVGHDVGVGCDITDGSTSTLEKSNSSVTRTVKITEQILFILAANNLSTFESI